MPLSEEELQIISEKPLGETLRLLRQHAEQGDIVSLIRALHRSPTARSLPVRDGNGFVIFRLFRLLCQFRQGLVQPERFRKLVVAVLSSSEADIWEASFHLIETYGIWTPCPSWTGPTFVMTPVKSNSSPSADSENVDNELFHEIKDCTFRSVGGFCDKFYNPATWNRSQKRMLKLVLSAHDGKKWTELPSTPDEAPVWTWFRSLEEHALAGAPHKLCEAMTANECEEQKVQMTVFFQKQALARQPQYYRSVLVVGLLKKIHSASSFKTDILQLTRHVRSIFFDQPMRRFVHAFTLCASTMELWVFDRSGPYSSGIFDIHEKPDEFARAFVAYATMDDNAMGLDLLIRLNERDYVTLDNVKGKKIKVGIGRAMIRKKAIVCRGTTCYETDDHHVAKFSWVSDKRKLEVEQMKLAKERGVRGVATVVAYRQITTIAALREGLQFKEAHRFLQLSEEMPSIDATTTLKSSAAASYQKRNSSSSSDPKRNSSSSSDPKRNSTSDLSFNANEPKRQRSKSRWPRLVAKLTDKLSLRKKKPSLYTPGDDLRETGDNPWENKIYCCLVVSPAGRVISKFGTALELVESMRDAIKAHQSLYIDGKMLHRDISSSNIIITRPKEAGGFKGMLIDLELAKERDSELSAARHRAGTLQFMAIEVLRAIDHTYRHDLESFFYVLLWICARVSWIWERKRFARGERPPQQSRLCKWEIGSFDDMAQAKADDMTVDGLEQVMDEFPTSLNAIKPLCLKIRMILFPQDQFERMNFGTPAGDPDQLYGPILAAYDEAIDGLK